MLRGGGRRFESVPRVLNIKEILMKRFIIVLSSLFFVAGCYIPYPSTGVRQPQVETYEKVCTVKTKKNGEKKTHCWWVRTR